MTRSMQLEKLETRQTRADMSPSPRVLARRGLPDDQDPTQDINCGIKSGNTQCIHIIRIDKFYEISVNGQKVCSAASS